MAPEVRGEGTEHGMYSPKADVYSMGKLNKSCKHLKNSPNNMLLFLN